MLKTLIIIAVITIVIGISFQLANAESKLTPDAMYHSKVHQHLYKAGVSFVHKQFDDHIIVLPRHKTGLEKDYNTPAKICAALKPIRTVKKVSVYGPGGKTSTTCQ